MTYEELRTVLILFGSLTAFMLGSSQLLLEKKNAKNVLIALVFFDTGLFQILNNFFVFKGLSNWHSIFPAVLLAESALVYALLPLTYLWIIALNSPGFRFTPRYLAHFLPSLIVALLELTLGESSPNPSVAAENYRDYLFRTNLGYRLDSIGSWVQSAAYGILIAAHYIPAMIRAKRTKRANLMTGLMLVFMMAYSTVVCVGYYAARGAFELLYETRMTLFVTVIFLVSYRFPFLLNIVKLEAFREGYVAPRADRLDSEAIVERIESLMTQEGIYRDGELTLKKLARKTELTPHQLSEILNTRLGKSFPQYLKEKRVEAAKRAIVDDTERKIIEIAVDCGFNSLSVFNAAFKSVTGMTPSRFRTVSGESGREDANDQVAVPVGAHE